MRRFFPWCLTIMLLVLVGAGAFSQPTTGIRAAGASVGKTIPSWPGMTSLYVGRYHLTMSSDHSLATAGELTIFLRVIPRVPKPALSGILTLSTKTESNVLYLTMFKHTSTTRWTTVNLGIFTGPVLGQFVVTASKAGQLTAQLVQKAKAPITFSFVRFSTNPHP